MRSSAKSPNPRVKTSPAEDHRRQMLWQVWVPLGASLFIILALAALTVAGAFMQSPQVERWGNLSAVWVILPVLPTGIVFLTILAVCVYGMSKLLKHMPDWMLKIQLLMIQFSLIVRRGADATTKPVIEVNGVNARVQSLWQQLFGKK